MRQRRLMNQINVVPYIDVMLVLLVIFMVTAPLVQTGSIDLPSVGKSSQPPVQPLEIIIRDDDSLALRDRSRGAEEVSLSQDELVARIKAAQEREAPPPVVISADKGVRYESVMKVMDALQKQQVAKVGLLVQLK